MKKGAIIAIELTVIFSLVGIIYWQLRSADAATDVRVTKLETVHQSLDLKMQNMAANIYLLCQSAKQKCIPPND